MFKIYLLLLVGGGATAARAGLLYYEGFNYAVAEDGLKNNGGFAPTPATGADTDIEPNSLRYMDAAGNVLQTTGQHAHVDSNEESATVSNIAPVLRLPNQQPSGSELWISFVGKQTAGSTLRFFNLSLRAPDNTLQPPDTGSSMDEIVILGMPSMAEAQLWRLWDRGTNQNLWASAISSTPSTDQSLIVARVELNAVDGLLERYTIWVNPRLDCEPADDDGFSMVSAASDFEAWSNLEQLRLAAGYDAANPSGWKVDEIRMADTWQEALPYIPLQVTLFPPALASPAKLQWADAPDFTESPEWSPDLRQWFPVTEPVTLSGTGLAACELAQLPAGKRFFRIRRSP